MEDGGAVGIEVIWRGERMKVGVASESDVRELGSKLVELTKVKPDTMKLLVPLPTAKGSRLVAPFSSGQTGLSLREAGLLEGKPIRMMGVSEGEIAEVSRSDLRIIGFDEEEERLRQRSLNSHHVSLKLPQGQYIFCEFRTLELPGIKLNPPASEALKRMHMLACDPGIIAIMNKHRWRVGIMTEMAPEGYVGISPKCILGFNKNHGEEISLRLRTDNLKGFRKYESIKKTLLHELAHMVYSEHDANFFALDKQLNQEAFSLDWTKSRGHTLAGRKFSRHYEDEDVIESSDYLTGQRLGGSVQLMPASARVASAIAAYNRLQNSSANKVEGSDNDTGAKTEDSVLSSQGIAYERRASVSEPDPDDNILKVENECEDAEPDPDYALPVSKDDMLIDLPATFSETKIEVEHDANVRMSEPDPDDSMEGLSNSLEEPDPDDSLAGDEPDLDDLESSRCRTGQEDKVEPDPEESGIVTDGWQAKHHTGQSWKEPDPDECNNGDVTRRGEAAIDVSHPSESTRVEPDPDDVVNSWENLELNMIEEPATMMCNRLQMAIKTLRSEAAPGEATSALQTLFKIIRNVIDHPNDVKFRRLRKGNPLFQKNVANYKAAMEVLAVVGFCEDVITDELGRSEAYMVLKRNDPGLLWLAKSSLEVSIA